MKSIKTPNHPTLIEVLFYPQKYEFADCTILGDFACISYLCLFIYLWLSQCYCQKKYQFLAFFTLNRNNPPAPKCPNHEYEFISIQPGDEEIKPGYKKKLFSIRVVKGWNQLLEAVQGFRTSIKRQPWIQPLHSSLMQDCGGKTLTVIFITGCRGSGGGKEE